MTQEATPTEQKIEVRVEITKAKQNSQKNSTKENDSYQNILKSLKSMFLGSYAG